MRRAASLALYPASARQAETCRKIRNSISLRRWPVTTMSCAKDASASMPAKRRVPLRITRRYGCNAHLLSSSKSHLSVGGRPHSFASRKDRLSVTREPVQWIVRGGATKDTKTTPRGRRSDLRSDECRWRGSQSTSLQFPSRSGRKASSPWTVAITFSKSHLLCDSAEALTSMTWDESFVRHDGCIPCRKVDRPSESPSSSQRRPCRPVRCPTCRLLSSRRTEAYTPACMSFGMLCCGCRSANCFENARVPSFMSQ
jgi:hypothetical protein